MKISISITFVFLTLVIFETKAQSTTPTAVATFECIGLYWAPADRGYDTTCTVEYRVSGTSTWKKGLNMWFDKRSTSNVSGVTFARNSSEYRGSIVGLKPGTTYNIRLTLSTGTTKTITAKTWEQDFPVGATNFLPVNSSSMLTISTSGTTSGYALYCPNAGSTATINVNNNATTCITINASYVIIRGLTLIGGKNHIITLSSAAHHVVIENCDMSGWGDIWTDGWGLEHDAAVYGNTSGANGNIVVQRCRIHHPRSDANCWAELRATYPSAANGHPQGPQAIELKNSAGNNVFRYNSIYSDMTHMLNDGIGGYDNGSYRGFTGPNSDIYGNIIMNCWDNPIELDGGAMNVRAWGNYTDSCYAPVSTVPVSVGPIYIFRNVFNKCWKDHSLDRGTRVIKAGNSATTNYYGDGAVFLFHNTMLQEYYNGKLRGGGGGLNANGSTANYVSRNNIWYLYDVTRASISDKKDMPESGFLSNSYDYDLYNGIISTNLTNPEPHGIKGVPTWASDNINMYNPLLTGKIRVALAHGTSGVDAGERIDNFNDNFTGNGPDIGANERGLTMEFGVQAYLDTTPQMIPQTITFNSIGQKTYGDAAFTLSSNGGGSGNPVTFTSSDLSAATISGNIVTIVGAGKTTITASQAGDANYADAADVQQTFAINKATLTVTAKDTVKVQGAENPNFILEYEGFVGSDNSSKLATKPVASCSATTTSPVGYYEIIPSGGTDKNYSFNYINGKLTIIIMTDINYLNSNKAEDWAIVYPNPLTSNILNIYSYSATNEDALVSITDLTGRFLYSKKLFLQDGKSTIKINDLSQGTYFVKVKTSNQLYFVKICRL